ncbi:hypothetical protein BJY01DRAFT_223406 [Aspergillus pseudoustus]|uniref:Secreted protein n=1 Tax=Aspergillus pseudoustus TaxID=1810923 RepID=A0ABR4J6I6_9EURO
MHLACLGSLLSQFSLVLSSLRYELLGLPPSNKFRTKKGYPGGIHQPIVSRMPGHFFTLNITFLTNKENSGGTEYVFGIGIGWRLNLPSRERLLVCL